MTADRFQRIEALYHRAAALAPADRGVFLDGACGDDLDLRTEVESLLAHGDGGTARIDLRPSSLAEDATLVERGPISEGPGMQIGPYKILQQIGEGGFGVVYMAEQEVPVRRKVALKIIKLGMDTKQVIGRFEVERQALALMDHPNIARVLDAGATETGRPYFVMELVRGMPITEYCDRQKLSTPKRLELFMEVCHAVQHAHHKGIIHRDLKPSNVLVTLHDHKAVPKIIDFGIAKATSHRLTEQTLFTEFRQFIGTPEYMSPDQAEISGLDIDTRSDIYSLGVLLYELLTGTTPLDGNTLRTVAHAEMQRMICEVDAPIPSTRVHTMATTGNGDSDSTASLAHIAGRRMVEPGGLRRMLRGDLDWIVMKALEKDRTRRYDSANDFAMDIERYLRNEPVLAGPPRLTYKLRKWVMRHRLGAIAGGVVAAALLVGATVGAIGLVRAAREAEHSRAVSEFLQTIVMETEVREASSDAYTVDQIVDRGRALFGDDHAVVGTLLMSRASTLSTAGRVEEAIQAQREALTFYGEAYGEDHATVASAQSALARLLHDDGDLTSAEAAYREALATKERVHGPMSMGAAEAKDRLTTFLVESGNQASQDDIKQLWGETVEQFRAALGDDHRVTVNRLCRYGVWLESRGFAAEALPVLEEGVERARRILREDDLIRFLAINSLARLYILHQPDLDRAIPMLDELYVQSTQIWGPTHTTSMSLIAQAAVHRFQSGDEEGAGANVRTFLASRREAVDPRDTNFITAEQQLWFVMDKWFDRNPDEGREFLLFFKDDLSVIVPDESPVMTDVLMNFGRWLADHQFDDDAIAFLRPSVTRRRAVEPVDRNALANSLVVLGHAMVRTGDALAAEAPLREALAIREEMLEPGDWRIASASAAIGFSLARQGRFDEAESRLVEGYEAMRSASECPDATVEAARLRVVELYESSGQHDRAAAYRDVDGRGEPQP